MASKNKYLFVFILIVIILISLGYIRNWPLYLTGGDLGFFENTSKIFLNKTLYVWSSFDGLGGLGIGKSGYISSLFIITLLGDIGFNPNIIQIIYISFFIIIGFIGTFHLLIYISKDHEIKKNYLLIGVLSFLYIFNFFTYSLFSIPLLSFLSFYLITPSIILLVILYLETHKHIYLILLLIVFFINQPTLTNISLLILQFMVVLITLFLIKGLLFCKGKILTILFILFTLMLIALPNIIEYLLYYVHSKNLLIESSINQAITKTSANVFKEIYSTEKMLSLKPGNIDGQWWSSKGLIQQFRFTDLYNSGVFKLLLYTPLLLILFSLATNERKQDKMYLIKYLLVFILTISIYKYSGWLISQADSYPFLSIFRNINKFSIFLNLFLVIVLLIALNNKRSQIIFYIYIMIFSFFTLTGFFFSYYNYSTLTKNYQPKIIESVLDKTIFENGKGNCFIYPADDFILWAYEWNYLGYSPLLTNQNTIPCFHKNGEILSHGNSEIFKKLKNIDAVNLGDFKKYNIKYIFLHKDINYNVFNRNSNMYTKSKKILNENFENIYENNNYILYKTYNEDKTLINFKKGNFTKLNPTKHKVKINNIISSEPITLLQSYHKEWKVYLNKTNSFNCFHIKNAIKSMDNITECESKEVFFEGEELSYLYRKPILGNTHKVFNKYANGWQVSKEAVILYVEKNHINELNKEGYPKKLKDGSLDYKYYILNPDGSIDAEFTLYFKPQSYFYLGLIISASTFILLVLWLTVDSVKNRKRIKRD